MTAKEEVGRKESVGTGVARMEVVEELEERGTGSTRLWVWMKVRVRMCWTKMVRACLGPNVSKMMRGHVVVTDALVAGVVVLDRVSWMDIAGSPFP